MKKYLALLILAAGLAAQGQAAHNATFNLSDTSCTTATGKACTVQIYAAVIASGTCPAVGNSAYSEIVNALTGTATASDTTWTYVDSRATLTSGSIYCAYETATYTAGGGPSAASAVFQATIPTPSITPPAAPTGTVTLE